MTPIRIFAALLWGLVFFLAVRQGMSLASLPATGEFEFNFKGWVTLALPAFFFATTPLWMRGHPLDMQQARAQVDARFGAGTYNTFMHTVRPVQLLAFAALATGASCVLSGHQAGAAHGAWGTGLFFISAGLGFVVSLVLLRAKGHRLE